MNDADDDGDAQWQTQTTITTLLQNKICHAVNQSTVIALNTCTQERCSTHS